MIRLFSKAKGGSATQPDKFVENMNMQSWLDEPLGTYSSGMLKKLSLALAFLGNPKFILLDEPLITLDAESLATLCSWIASEHTINKTSFLISSHQPLPLETRLDVRVLSVDLNTVTLHQ
jgi:ABC-2 type transport system ATP-binding protein